LTISGIYFPRVSVPVLFLGVRAIVGHPVRALIRSVPILVNVDAALFVPDRAVQGCITNMIAHVTMTEMQRRQSPKIVRSALYSVLDMK
jgi:hypothetical protein